MSPSESGVFFARVYANRTHAQQVGNVTSYTLDVNKDTSQFGVRAVDAQGHRSPVSYAMVAP